MTFAGEWTVRFTEDVLPHGKVRMDCSIYDHDMLLGGYTMVASTMLGDTYPEVVAVQRELALRSAVEDVRNARIRKSPS
jgi:hypothetical protein